MVRVSDLYALQLVDSEIDEVERTLTELRGRQTPSEELAELRERLPELEATVRSTAAELREAETEVEDGKEKLAAVETKLYSGSVTATKELRDLQKELEILQRQQRTREERALQAMIGADEARGGLSDTRERIENGAAAWDADQAQIVREIAEIEARLEVLRGRREAARWPIEQPTLALYDRLRRMRAGRAVARVQGGACLGCRIALPSTVFQRARSGMNVVQCTSCERILYVG
jgi:predicted  nucleic acid-binding Zn-ribbon protein